MRDSTVLCDLVQFAREIVYTASTALLSFFTRERLLYDLAMVAETLTPNGLCCASQMGYYMKRGSAQHFVWRVFAMLRPLSGSQRGVDPSYVSNTDFSFADITCI
eukprot:IDg5366t1